MIDIQFIDVPALNLEYVDKWIEKVIKEESRVKGELCVVLGTDDWLLDKNKTYLNHDFYTDIITFDYCEDNWISGDLLISLDRVYDNAEKFNVSRETELNRVIVHGVLHLLGYNDETDEEIEIIRKKEDFYLSLL